jgi:hypothetical protein
MAIHSLEPAFVRVFIDNPFSNHVHTHPVLAWVGTPFTTPGEFVAWDESPIAADTMIEGMLTDMLPLLSEDSTVTGYEILTMSSPTADPLPVFIKSLTGFVGTSTATGWAKAVQRTYTLLSAAGGLARKVVLDEPSNNNFDAVLSLGATVDADWIAHFLDVSEAWCARDGSRLVAFKSLKYIINEKLKRNYGN